MKRLMALLLMAFCSSHASAQSHPAACDCTTGSALPVLTCSDKQPMYCMIAVGIDLSSARCKATLPYCVLCVRRKDSHSGDETFPTVTWKPPAGYKFHASDGIRIESSGASFLIDAIEPLQFFSWKAGSGNSPPNLHGNTAALFPKAVGGQQCTTSDARLIVNTDQ